MERKSNIELLRIVCMLMIILWHINIGFGGDKNLATFSLGNIINAVTVVGVNCFVLISGYFGIKFRLKALISLLLQCLFYSIVISVACHETIGSNIDFKMLFLPISSDVWWFMTVYVMLYLSAPLLNKALDGMSMKGTLFSLLSFLIINIWFGYCFKNDNNPSGHSYLQFVLMYLIGRMISFCRANVTCDFGRYSKFLFVNSGGAMLAFVILICINMFFIKSYRYNNPLVVLSSVAIFIVFFNMKIGSIRQVNLLASTVVAAYLIHEHPQIRPLLAEKVMIIHNSFPVYYEILLFLLIAFSFIVLGFFVEKIRRFLMNPLINSVFNRIENKRYKI